MRAQASETESKLKEKEDVSGGGRQGERKAEVMGGKQRGWGGSRGEGEGVVVDFRCFDTSRCWCHYSLLWRRIPEGASPAVGNFHPTYPNHLPPLPPPPPSPPFCFPPSILTDPVGDPAPQQGAPPGARRGREQSDCGDAGGRGGQGRQAGGGAEAAAHGVEGEGAGCGGGLTQGAARRGAGRGRAGRCSGHERAVWDGMGWDGMGRNGTEQDGTGWACPPC